MANCTWNMIVMESHDLGSSGHILKYILIVYFQVGVESLVTEAGDDGTIKGSGAAKQNICI